MQRYSLEVCRLTATVLLFGTVAFTRPALGQDIAENAAAPVVRGVVELPNAPSAMTAGDDVPIEDVPHSEATVMGLPKHVLLDMGHIAISPSYIRTRDLKWLLPLTAATGAAFVTDTHTMREVVSQSPSFNNTAINVSDGLRDGFIAVPAGIFLMGHFTDSEHSKETGLLAGEAVIDANIVAEVVKLVSFRERPLEDNAQGEFFVGKSGPNGSFISGHAVTAWSSAAVLAAEYKSPWAQVAIYSLATGTSLTRVLGQQHFPSDVLIGSATGWLIGHYVYRAHRHWHVAAR
jgi:membrane-associated phospholipid phosphatase